VYKCAVDDRDLKRPPTPLADDPEFLDRLLDLDRGLMSGRAQPGAARRPPPPTVRAASDARAEHASLVRPLPPSITAPFESLTKPGLPGETAHAHGRRPLLDLFPLEASRPGRSAIRTRPSAPVAPAASAAPTPQRAPVAQRRDEAQDLDRIEATDPSIDTAFALSSNPRFFYHSTPHDAACQQLLTAIGRREGLVVLTGVFGAGKTTLCRTVIEQLGRRTLTSLITDPFVSGEELLKQILADFGVLSREELARGPFATRHELSTTLQAFVESLAPLEASAVVIVDEAQNLPPDVFDQVRLLCEAADTSARLQVVLVGQPALNERLRRPENKSLHARVAVRCSLEPLPGDELADYIAHRIGIAGTHSGVTFDVLALARIFALSEGVPRMVNLVCERALARAHETSATVVSEALVDMAADDLDLTVPRAGQRTAARVVGAAALVLFVLMGAAAAAWVFRDAVGRTLAQWRSPATTQSSPAR
jgi:type II secretory pathway predicted ATPase ExeA